jgi:hypothetical protein
MFSVCATRRLLDRLRPPIVDPEQQPTTRLGNWYANLVPLPAGEFLICVSERTLLPVILPVGALPDLTRELSKALTPILASLGVDQALIEQERFAMAQSSFSTTNSRRIVGFMNEFAFMISDRLGKGQAPMMELSLWLSGTPCQKLFPDRATRELFSA